MAAGEMFVVHQPIVSIHTGRIVGLETLVRWRHPERGVLTPPAFLEVAEETGVIGPIGDWVTAEGARTLRRLIDDGVVERTTSLHINVSSRQLSDANFVERTVAAVSAAGLDAARERLA
ncbi:MAG: EAL domain-containing protein, partial [Actinobacteria bacterium]|nr:EAL domain-containing protein [Actinomycetota bacterium]